MGIGASSGPDSHPAMPPVVEVPELELFEEVLELSELFELELLELLESPEPPAPLGAPVVMFPKPVVDMPPPTPKPLVDVLCPTPVVAEEPVAEEPVAEEPVELTCVVVTSPPVVAPMVPTPPGPVALVGTVFVVLVDGSSESEQPHAQAVLSRVAQAKAVETFMVEPWVRILERGLSWQ